MKHKTKKAIIKLFVFIITCILFTPINKSNADYEEFLDWLKNINIPVDDMMDNKWLSRYEITRLLNAVECNDCINPDTNIINRYNSSFWTDFKLIAWNNFNDIWYAGWEWNNKKYYYCVAYVWDNDYMNWYPINTSPICAGKFCWAQTVNKAEFIQVIINLISNYIYWDISTNRDNVKSWVDELDKDKYQYKTFDLWDIKTIEDNSKSCDKTCKLWNWSEVKTYLKYCMFNLDDCGMTPIWKIWQWYRPVAELNLLKNQNILELDQDYWNNIWWSMDVKKIFEVIYKLSGKIDCEFDPDYDCDGILNSKDNCTINYNTSQKDFDKDGLWDVCDDDIDNDWDKNPIWIVDESWKINIRVRTQSMDNCLFVVNPDQKDWDKNWIWDSCETTNQDYLSMYIYVDNLTGSAPLNVSMKAITNWTYKDISWRFSDWYETKWEEVKHTLLEPWIYNVSAIAKWKNNDAYASTTIIVWENPNEIYWIWAMSQKIGWEEPFETTLKVGYIWDYDWVSRNFWDKEIVENQDRSFKKVFLYEWTQKITIKAMKDDKIRWVSQFNVWLWNWNPGSIIKSSILNPEIWKNLSLSTEYDNFWSKDVSYVERNRGDGKIEKNNYLSNSHVYDLVWQKVIIQKIVLKNWISMTNMITVFVVDKELFKSNAIMINPSTLNNKVGSKILFDVKILWSKVTSYINIIFQFTTYLSDMFSKKDGKIDFSYDLINKGLYYPSTKININQCSYLKADMTLYVKWYDFCMTKKSNWDIDKYKCDMDKDSIPDICDDDIDWDWVKNLLGLINYESNDCSLEIFGNEKDNNLKQLSVDMLKKHFQWVCSLDNAPFDVNKSQEDLNIDGIWDVMWKDINWNEEKISMFVGDSDGDWIFDYEDKCMLIQETYNWLNDTDWCPEIGSDASCNKVNSCWDWLINVNETCDNCPSDVWICDETLTKEQEYCGDKIISSDEFCRNCPVDVWSCVSKCGNWIADLGENFLNCPSDVKTAWKCGNNIKDPDESCSSCPEDYGQCSVSNNQWSSTGTYSKCGNGIIDLGETCNNCPSDVRRCYFPYGEYCGDKIISSDEFCRNCPVDVWSCEEEIEKDVLCWNGKVEIWETCISCPIDVWNCEEDIEITTEKCLQCPCPYTSSDGDIKNWNTVRATLWSQKMIIQYISSSPWIVDF